ncbi:hypothetical protein IEO21_08719 [Rhodonia placenta]|uniref:FAD/NAD(P)-binding domain-containing protein n=1 Tax=Rhodonia placenta TaxID=104341 RepID=A0A8H7NW38_9APHY|nr:hypothetical protein IEO21_08719 [Postia placenta]
MALQSIAETWLRTFALAASTGDVPAIVQTFLPDGFLRDLLVFTWDVHSLEGHDKMTAHLRTTLAGAQLSNFKIETRPGLCAEPSTKGGVGASFTFEMPRRYGRGYVRLLQGQPSNEWKAMAVYLAVDDLKGHEELGPEPGVYGGHTLAWEEVFAARRARIEQDPYVIVLGAGQNGLNAAARLKQWNISTLVLEKNARIGDQWRGRYPTLSLHSIRNWSHLAYHPFPEKWPEYAPREKMGAWLEQYADTQDIVVWTRSKLLPGARYDSASGRWTVIVDRAGTLVQLHPAHVVCAVGSTGPPRMPLIPDRPRFAGEVMHSSAYPGGSAYTGKHVVVVGACQSASDICQDLAFRGAYVTMIQRSSTCVVTIKTAADDERACFPDGVPTDLCDLKFHSLPMGLRRRLSEEDADLNWERERELHAKLRKGGLKLNMGRNGSGHVFLIYERLGGWDLGLSDYIGSGRVKIKQGVEIKQYVPDGVMCTDNTFLRADAVILATGWQDPREGLKDVFGANVLDKTKTPWGLDDEDEISGCCRPTGHPGLWYALGDLATSRFYSKLLALQIKAIQVGMSAPAGIQARL